MLNSPVIEIAIGLVLLYLVLGLVCTSVNEYIAQLLSLRAENLVEAIYGMFSGEDRHKIAEDIYDHADVRSICRKQWGIDWVNKRFSAELDKLPSAIQPEVFSGAIIDLLRANDESTKKGNPIYHDSTTSALKNLIDEGKRMLAAAAPAAVALPADVRPLDQFDHAREAIEKWYGQVLARAGGWYKRRAQVMSFLVAAGLVFVINADTITMYQLLVKNPVERAKLDAMASQVKQTTSPPNQGNANDQTGASTKTTDSKTTPGDIEISEALKSASFDFLGWQSSNSRDPRHWPAGLMDWLIKLLGLGISAFAVSLGAPFWFDVLGKFMNVRSGGDPNKKPAKEGAK